MANRSLISELAAIWKQISRTGRTLNIRQRWALSVALLTMFVASYLITRLPVIVSEEVDRLFVGGEDVGRTLVLALCVVAGLLLVHQLLGLVRHILLEWTCTRVEYDATVAGASRLLSLDLGVLGSEASGALNGRLHRSIQGLVRLLKLAFLDFLPAVSTAAFALVTAYMMDLWLGVLMTIAVPAGVGVILYQLASQRGVREALVAGKEELDATIVEQLNGIEYIRASDGTRREILAVDDTAGRLRSREFRHHQAMARFDLLKGGNEAFFYVLIFGAAAWRAIEGSISPGEVMAFLMLYQALTAPLRETHRVLDEAHEASIHADKYFEMLDQDRDISFETCDAEAPGQQSACLIRATDLVVCNSSGSGELGQEPALRHINFEMKTGEAVGLVGTTGSGKSTFIRTILRLVHPSGGSLVIDGSPICEWSRQNIAERIGYVSQRPFLVRGSIHHNIAYERPDASRAEVAAAAARAQVADEIEAMPGGYDRLLGERGHGVSGGQAQRIALARIFLRSPDIIILDEATSGLDVAKEAAVMRELQWFARDKSLIVIAHRLESLSSMDRLYVFKDGKIVESGSLADLKKLDDGELARMISQGAGGASSRPQLVEA